MSRPVCLYIGTRLFSSFASRSSRSESIEVILSVIRLDLPRDWDSSVKSALDWCKNCQPWSYAVDVPLTCSNAIELALPEANRV